MSYGPIRSGSEKYCIVKAAGRQNREEKARTFGEQS